MNAALTLLLICFAFLLGLLGGVSSIKITEWLMLVCSVVAITSEMKLLRLVVESRNA